MRKRAYVYLILTLAIAAFILFTSTNTEDAHSALGGETIEWINVHIFGGSLIEAEKSAIVGVSAKLFGHFSLFLLDGLFARFFLLETKLSKKGRLLCYLLFGIALSSAGEIIQVFSAGRTPAFTDVLLDFSGFVLPLVTVGLLKLG